MVTGKRSSGLILVLILIRLTLEILGNNMLMSIKGKQLWKRLPCLSLFPFLASQGEACSEAGLFLLGQHTEAQMLLHTGRAQEASTEGNPSHLLVSISRPLPQAGRNAPSPWRSPLYYPFYVWGKGVSGILQRPKINWQAPPSLVLSWKHCWCSPSSQPPSGPVLESTSLLRPLPPHAVLPQSVPWWLRAAAPVLGTRALFQAEALKRKNEARPDESEDLQIPRRGPIATGKGTASVGACGCLYVATCANI